MRNWGKGLQGNMGDLKGGDYEEKKISLHVKKIYKSFVDMKKNCTFVEIFDLGGHLNTASK